MQQLGTIQDSEEVTIIEKKGTIERQVKLIPAKDFDGSPLSQERKQKIFDFCVQE